MDELQARLAALAEQAGTLSSGFRNRGAGPQKQRIETYQVQARYELAAIYDKTAHGGSRRRPHPHGHAAGGQARVKNGGGRVMRRALCASQTASVRAWRARPRANPPTIKDLEHQQIEVKTDPPRGVDTNKTMDSYSRFLDLNAGDAALRAEAMRRLGDLNLESSESERIEKELVTNEGLRATEAIHLYSALLKAYPKYERNDAVLYQLARAYELNAQPDKALASLDQLVASYPASHYIDEAQFRRGELLFSSKSYPGASGLRGRGQDRSRVGFLQPKPVQARMVVVQAG